MFAESGLGVSSRDITSAAEANLAAINYHFGSKDQLIREAFHRLASMVNSKRLAALDAYEESVGNSKPKVEPILRAHVEPAVRATLQSQDLDRYYNRYAFLFYEARQRSGIEALAAETDIIVERFTAALSRALPHLTKAELLWRYDFMIAAIVHILLDAETLNRVSRLSSGECRTKDPDEVIRQLLSFLKAGMAAPAPH